MTANPIIFMVASPFPSRRWGAAAWPEAVCFSKILQFAVKSARRVACATDRSGSLSVLRKAIETSSASGIPLAARQPNRWSRWAPILTAFALAVFAIVAVRSLREPVLRAAGGALVASEPVASADVIILAIDSEGAGALEAADLVRSGVSKRVAVFHDDPSTEHDEFIRRGLPYEDTGARQIRQLTSLGVTDVEQISSIAGTEGEGRRTSAMVRRAASPIDRGGGQQGSLATVAARARPSDERACDACRSSSRALLKF